ncbi:hypothetical protein M3J09_010947 [Ascochyta lentis]
MMATRGYDGDALGVTVRCEVRQRRVEVTQRADGRSRWPRARNE